MVPDGSGPSRAARYPRQLAGLEQLPRAEAADVPIGDVRAIVQSENGPAMGIVGQRSRSTVPEASRHPEVDQEHPTRFEPNDQILAATLDRLDALADELGGDDLGREGRTSRGSLIVALDDLRALEHGRDAGADGLDLGQLGHASSLAVPVLVGSARCPSAGDGTVR